MKPIIFFDSGIGGVSIWREFVKLVPHLPIHYIADQDNFPYGTKSQSWIKRRVELFINWFQDLDPLAIVIACNTATTQAISTARVRVSCPVIGIEPLVKPLLRYKKSLLLMTESSLRSTRTRELLESDNKCSISPHTPKGLAAAIEDMNEIEIDKILSTLPKITKDPEAIGLSCTHYSLIASKFQEIFPKAQIIDPSLAVTKRLISQLELSELKNKHLTTTWHTTGPVVRLKNQLQYYLNITDEVMKVSI